MKTHKNWWYKHGVRLFMLLPTYICPLCWSMGPLFSEAWLSRYHSYTQYLFDPGAPYWAVDGCIICPWQVMSFDQLDWKLTNLYFSLCDTECKIVVTVPGSSEIFPPLLRFIFAVDYYDHKVSFIVGPCLIGINRSSSSRVVRYYLHPYWLNM